MPHLQFPGDIEEYNEVPVRIFHLLPSFEPRTSGIRAVMLLSLPRHSAHSSVDQSVAIRVCTAEVTLLR
jgi:hypothetical protein